jgi:hypothetical protein
MQGPWPTRAKSHRFLPECWKASLKADAVMQAFYQNSQRETFTNGNGLKGLRQIGTEF